MARYYHDKPYTAREKMIFVLLNIIKASLPIAGDRLLYFYADTAACAVRLDNNCDKVYNILTLHLSGINLLQYGRSKHHKENTSGLSETAVITVCVYGNADNTSVQKTYTYPYY